ncbi:MAG TPA: OmpA family protein [Ignavibacteriaceae bacterium]|nr:OmpA family protein [Ignavibacteriaceae bacterium]
MDESLFGEGSDKDRYLITYSDLITLLLGLFIILYAISNIDARKYEKMITAISYVFGHEGKIVGLKNDVINVELPSNNLKNELADIIKEYKYDNYVKLEENERGITIHIMDEILFPSGSAELNKNSLVVLKNIASVIRKLPNDIRVEGHTDNVPISKPNYPSNWHLSVARALNTAYYLINNENLPSDKVSIVGYSEYKPIASNDTEEGRSMNRRVDLVIVNK